MNSSDHRFVGLPDTLEVSLMLTYSSAGAVSCTQLEEMLDTSKSVEFFDLYSKFFILQHEMIYHAEQNEKVITVREGRLK